MRFLRQVEIGAAAGQLAEMPPDDAECGLRLYSHRHHPITADRAGIPDFAAAIDTLEDQGCKRPIADTPSGGGKAASVRSGSLNQSDVLDQTDQFRVSLRVVKRASTDHVR